MKLKVEFPTENSWSPAGVSRMNWTMMNARLLCKLWDYVFSWTEYSLAAFCRAAHFNHSDKSRSPRETTKKQNFFLTRWTSHDAVWSAKLLFIVCKYNTYTALVIRMCTAYVCTVYWWIRKVISSPKHTVYTLKHSGMHPVFSLMCTRIKHLGKVFIKNTKIAQVCFPIWCETCCLMKTIDQSQNVCR